MPVGGRAGSIELCGIQRYEIRQIVGIATGHRSRDRDGGGSYSGIRAGDTEREVEGRAAGVGSVRPGRHGEGASGFSSECRTRTECGSGDRISATADLVRAQNNRRP